MGGGGRFFDRDVKDGYTRTDRGYSVVAEQQMSAKQIDPGLLPFNRRIVSRAKCPVVLNLDDTGSMDILPKIYFDKIPMMAGQIVQCGYLPPHPEMSLSFTGDIVCDEAPIQICDFCAIKDLDGQFKRAWLERGGGYDDRESYEYLAFFYARKCDIPDAEMPFFVFTGDEGFRKTLYATDLNRHFGGEHERVDTTEIFQELREKFQQNVFLIHRTYGGGTDAVIVREWEEVLGEENVIRLGSDQAIADVTLGLFAIRTGVRTLDAYLDDLRTTRDVPQTEARIREVRTSLCKIVPFTPTQKKEPINWL